MRSTAWRWIGLISLVCLLNTSCHLVTYVRPNSPDGLLIASLNEIYNVVEPPPGRPQQTFHVRFKVVEVEGIAKDFPGGELDVAVQAPDRLRIATSIKGANYQLGRDGQQLWMYAVDKKFGLIGVPGVPLFQSEPDRIDTKRLERLEIPLPRKKLSLLPYLVNVRRSPDTLVGTNLCHVLTATPTDRAIKGRTLQRGMQLQLWIRRTDRLPQRLSYSSDRGIRVTIEAEELGYEPAWSRERWALAPEDGRTETVALSHLTEFISSRLSAMKNKTPPLGPVTGERRLVATEGKGRLELIDGTRVLFVKGSPEEMGRQHGVLMEKQIRDGLRRVLYGMGVGNSLGRGTWFFGEIENAQQRLLPHMDERYLREMDAMAAGARISKAEMRMANVFPELFHCSGFAIYGDATIGGRMFHGRILDYFRGMGLEQNAVVIVFQPDYGNAWVNVSYAGFVGSVTAMNEKHVAIGEMGGRGEGQWDGKPMAQLVREVMEQADTIDEAVEIMRRGPRTCEYYYVISDAKSKRAVAIYATPTKFETAWAGESHPLIPEAIKDAVLISGGDRFAELTRRIKAGYGQFDAQSARDLMTRPVCMPSNIHSVLFAPDTLDFWVANADSKNVASHARYTHYNLAELLKLPPSKTLADNRN